MGAGNSLVLFIVAIVCCRLSIRQGIIVAATDALTVVAIFGVSLLTETGSGLSTVIKGLGSELKHAETAHDLEEWFWDGYGLTHFRYHLIPSLTGPTVAIALGAIAVAIIADRNRYVATYAGAALLWLFLLELSPLKLVGLMRYILPVVIYLLLAAGIACSRSIAPETGWLPPRSGSSPWLQVRMPAWPMSRTWTGKPIPALRRCASLKGKASRALRWIFQWENRLQKPGTTAIFRQSITSYR